MPSAACRPLMKATLPWLGVWRDRGLTWHVTWPWSDWVHMNEVCVCEGVVCEKHVDRSFALTLCQEKDINTHGMVWYIFIVTAEFSAWNSGCSSQRERVAIVRRHPFFFLFFSCVHCVFVYLLGWVFYRTFARDNSLVAVGSFTCAECVLHTGPRFIVSSERLAPRPHHLWSSGWGKGLGSEQDSNPWPLSF